MRTLMETKRARRGAVRERLLGGAARQSGSPLPPGERPSSTAAPRPAFPTATLASLISRTFAGLGAAGLEGARRGVDVRVLMSVARLVRART